MALDKKTYLEIGDIIYPIKLESDEELKVNKELNKPSTFQARLLQQKIIPFNYNNQINGRLNYLILKCNLAIS